MRPSLAALVLMFAGCAEVNREARMRERLEPFAGVTVESAINMSGPPSEVYENGKWVLYIWTYDGPTVTRAMGAAVPLGTSTLAGASAVTQKLSCRVWLVVDKEANRVQETHWEGEC